MSKIIGNTTATPVPRSDWEQTDKTKADFIRHKPTLGAISEKDVINKDDLSTDIQSSLEQLDDLQIINIDLSASNEGESNLLNADTLGGKPADFYENDIVINMGSIEVDDVNPFNADTLGGYLPEDFVRHIENKPKAGFIYPLASEVVPEGFLLCDGAEYGRQEYPELFTAIGTMYGEGNGSTTFNVPNLQTRVPVGSGDGYELGDVGGEESHTLTTDEMPSHSHLQYVGANSGSWGVRLDYSSDGSCHKYPQGETGTAGGSQPHNNMQPYTVVNYIIATGKDTGVSVQDIITGVQALPLGVEYGGTGATNAAAARENLGITKESLGIHEFSKELLWENANPNNQFPSQTIILDLSNYNIILIETRHNNDSYFDNFNLNASMLIVGFNGTCMGYYENIDGSGISYREADIHKNSIWFNSGHENTAAPKDSFCIPVRIYGIKGVM